MNLISTRFKRDLTSLRKAPGKFLMSSLESIEKRFELRLLLYITFLFLSITGVFVSLKYYEYWNGLPMRLSFFGMYAWHSVINFSLCFIVICEAWTGLRRKLEYEHPFNVLSFQLLGIISFVIAFLIQRTVVFSAIERYDMDLFLFYKQYPALRPYFLRMIIWCLISWIPFYFLLTLFALRIQKRTNTFHKPKKTTDNLTLDGGKLILKKSLISHLSMEDHYAKIYWRDKEEVTHQYVRISLKKVKQQLDSDRFIQIHRSHLVQLEKVDRLFFEKQKWFVSISGEILPVSRSYLPKLKEILL